nr:LOW QUALITY PROTEIN: leukocyte immunoglobulin-like receptor subfamily A member 5 [Cavia porcellus]
MAQQGPAGTLPKPTLWAIPGSVIPRGSSVSLWCQGTLGVQSYSLNKEGRSRFLGKPNLHGNKAKFSIPSMTRDDAGRYRCYYLSGADWSKPSEALELVVTGVYSKPSISALPSTVVTSGAIVTLQCATGQRCDRFILTKEGEANLSWNLESRCLPNGQFQAFFPVGPVILGPRLSFRCYSYDKESPHVWSIPSDPLEVVVSESSTPSPPCSGPITTPGCTGGPISPPSSLGSTEGESWAPSQRSYVQAAWRLSAHLGSSHSLSSSCVQRPKLQVVWTGPGQESSEPQDYTVGNLIHMGLAGLVLVALGILLFWHQCHQRRTQDAARM